MTPKPGDFFVTESLSTEWRGQLMAYAIQFGTKSHVNHAGLYIGGNQIIEARPDGAGYAPLSEYQSRNTVWSALPLTDTQRTDIANAATTLIGTPYGWPDAIAIALAQPRLGRHLDTTKPLDQQPWWYKRIAREDRLICSQLVDYAHYLGGVNLYDDGRPFGLVSPADLEKLV
jgi:cell wall-associated NlpC family hydrolase